MKKIILAIDSFKGSLTSVQAAGAAEKGILSVFPECEVVKIPVADGGEGTAEALIAAMGGSFVSARTHDPLMRPITACYGVTADGVAAVVETAAASGLPLLLPGERDPLKATSYGTGELIVDAVKRGCRHVILGAGGSATNDAGTGLLKAMGFAFLDSEGREVTSGGGSLCHITAVDAGDFRKRFPYVKFTVAYDVNNPFCGPDGAARIYSPQKGADAAAVEELERGMADFASVIKAYSGMDISALPGGGAAGGISAALHAFLSAELVRGIDLVLKASHFEERLHGADLVITGEGKIDLQTLGGKAPFGVMKLAKGRGVPVIAIAGKTERREELLKAGFDNIYTIRQNEGEGIESMVSGHARPDSGRVQKNCNMQPEASVGVGAAAGIAEEDGRQGCQEHIPDYSRAAMDVENCVARIMTEIK